MVRHSSPLLLIMAMASVVIAGCLGPDGESRYGDLPARTANAERRWAQSSIENYQFRYSRSCYCPMVVNALVTVTGDSIVSVTDSLSGQPVDPIPPTVYRIVPGWFAFVREAMDRRAAVIEVEYDQALGYPRRIYIDYVQEMVDDELGIRIWDLTEISLSP